MSKFLLVVFVFLTVSVANASITHQKIAICKKTLPSLNEKKVIFLRNNHRNAGGTLDDFEVQVVFLDRDEYGSGVENSYMMPAEILNYDGIGFKVHFIDSAWVDVIFPTSYGKAEIKIIGEKYKCSFNLIFN